jgi:hypothetical protein
VQVVLHDCVWFGVPSECKPFTILAACSAGCTFTDFIIVVFAFTIHGGRLQRIQEQQPWCAPHAHLHIGMTYEATQSSTKEATVAAHDVLLVQSDTTFSLYAVRIHMDTPAPP